MRRVSKILEILMFSAMVLAAVPTPAQAAFSWFWLDNLSGPGPFQGVESEWRIRCFGGTPPAQVGVRVVGVESDCRSGTKEKHKRSLNVTGALYFTTSNNLAYKASDVDKKIGLLRVGPSFAWAFEERTLELKAGVEWDYFFGPAFDNFSRLAVPLLLDYKPFVNDRNNTERTLRNIVTVRVGVMIIPKGFDASDFGAIPGSFHTSFEALPTVGLVFDLGHRL